MTIKRLLFRANVRILEKLCTVQPVKKCHTKNLSIDRLPIGNRHTDIITIAFNNDKIIPLHTHYIKENYTGEHTHIIADNSTDSETSRKIREYCSTNGIAYIRISHNYLGKIAGPSYSHATALNYCYQHIIKKRQPAYFGFTDHDLFPLKEVDLSSILERQYVYGPLRARAEFWYLSAILCFFNYRYLKDKKVDFMPVTYKGTYLDSGGGNWKEIYQGLDKKQIAFCTERMDNFEKGDNRHQDMVEIFDEKWLHTINGSYWKKIAVVKEKFLDTLVAEYAVRL